MSWNELIEQITPHVGGHTIMLRCANGKFVRPEDALETGTYSCVAVAFVREGIAPSETETPAKQMAEILTGVLGKPLPVLLSREIDSYCGYYVHIAIQAPVHH